MAGVHTFRSIDDWIYEHLTRRTRVLFVLSDGYGFACQAPVIRALLDCPDVRVRTTSDRDLSVDQIEFANESDHQLYASLALPTWRARFSKWHMVVDTHLNGFYPARNGLRIYMHHGPGFGILGNKIAIMKQCDIFCGLSEIEGQWFERIEPSLFGKQRAFFPVGFPKNDALYRREHDRKALLESLRLPDRTTLLITSHWQKSSILRRLGAEPFRRLTQAFPDYNVIQTGHPWLWQPNHNVPAQWQHALLEELREVEMHHGHARFIQSSDVESLLAAADLLVGDYSSVMTTYSLLDRPIVYFDEPNFEFAIPELKNVFVNAAHTFNQIDELILACRTALSNPEDKAPGRAVMRATFNANEGRAGEYMANLIRHIGRTCTPLGMRWERVLSAAINPDRAALEVESANEFT